MWRSLYVLGCCMAFLCLAVPGRAEDEEVREEALARKYLEIPPPAGWKRTAVREGMFKGCYAYAREDEAVVLLACTVKDRASACKELEEDAEPGTLHKLGNTLYFRQENALFICAPTRDGKAYGFFTVMAEDVLRRHEARAVLAGFTKFDIPPEERGPAMNLRAYRPASLVPKSRAEYLGQPSVSYENPAWKAERPAWVTLAPIYPHWTSVEECVRGLEQQEHTGALKPVGRAWGEDSREKQTRLAVSHDKKVLLILHSPNEAATREIMAAYDKFDW